MPSVSMLRVLVADDNPLSLQFFHAALTTLGVDCIQACDGAAALALAHRDAFDLMLLDVHMPLLDGPQALKQIRAQQGPSQCATALATTADNDVATGAALRDAGFADVLVKPLTVEALRAALDRHLPARHSQKEPSDSDEWLDEDHALAVAGGDRAISNALRGLLVAELDSLPAELALISERRDAHALRERLHRLDASAGFCGVPALVRAGSLLRNALDAPLWPARATFQFLDTSKRARELLAQAISTGVDGRRTP